MGVNPDNPKTFERMGSLGSRAKTFMSKLRPKTIRKLQQQNSSNSSLISDGEEEKEQKEKQPETKIEHQVTEKLKEEATTVQEEEDVVIVGGGIVGLVLALSLNKHAGLKARIYEQAPAFQDDVGAGMGMYPNGLRVIRDIDPTLLKNIQDAGYPYLYRRWERHDGTEVAIAQETVLAKPNITTDAGNNANMDSDDDLHPLGIRRWRLQKLLYQAVKDAGIPIYFNKQLQTLEEDEDTSTTSIKLTFQDETVVKAKVVLAADGSRSRIRDTVLKNSAIDKDNYSKLHYTGVTCLMGTSYVARQDRGISLPASETTKCHGAFYPTGPNEQCFQFHFPTTSEDAVGSWGTLTELVGQEECTTLRHKLEEDGWDDKYLDPLSNVEKAVKIGFSVLEPQLESYVHGKHHNIVLVGDAAHPPVPYLGQGAQQGLEDAGTLAMLFEHLLMVDDDGDGQPSSSTFETKNKKFSTTNLSTALKLYNRIRVPRTQDILEHSKLWGKQQQKRSECSKYNKVKEEKIQRDVFYHETVSDLLPGVHHDYKEDVLAAIQEAPLSAVAEEDEE